MTFKKNDLVFLNIKNIIIDKSFKKLNDKMFGLFKIIFVIDFFFISWNYLRSWEFIMFFILNY